MLKSFPVSVAHIFTRYIQYPMIENPVVYTKCHSLSGVPRIVLEREKCIQIKTLQNQVFT